MTKTQGAGGNALRHPTFRAYFAARTLSAFGIQITSVAVGWAIYEATRDPFALGLVGLAQFLPTLLLCLVSGQLADRFPRQTIMAVCGLGEALCAAALLWVLTSPVPTLWLAYSLLVCFGICRAFLGPAVQAMMANTTPKDDLPSAVSWSSGIWQLATITGPVVGGLAYGVDPELAFGLAVACFAGASVLSLRVRPITPQQAHAASGTDVIAGLRYVLRNPVVFGAISLDLFIVLLGGVTALLPVIALDLLDAGPVMLGLLRAAPGVGGVAVAIWLATHPIRRHAGRVLFISVAIFGAVTVVLGLIPSAPLAVVCLILIGGSDMVSVYIRSSVIQLGTPDEVRGRVSALNMVFVGASNELGEFRSGSIAALVGSQAAIVFGGACSLVVAGVWGLFCTALRQVDTLSELTPVTQTDEVLRTPAPQSQ